MDVERGGRRAAVAACGRPDTSSNKLLIAKVTAADQIIERSNSLFRNYYDALFPGLLMK